MFVWRKRASIVWLAANESKLREIAGEQLAIIEQANRKNSISEIAGASRPALEKIRSCFGGKIERLPRSWLAKFSRVGKTKPLRVGSRLVITRSGGFQTAVYGKSAARKTPLLVIPAGMAFGTGEHATTAMALRLLEQATRGWGAQAGSLRSPDKCWSLLDLGTGSGILALAAKKFGAKKVVAIDLDPTAILTAKENARRNRIRDIEFRVSDARKFRSAAKFRVVSANLFSELLIEVLPQISRMLKQDGCAILSGILRAQEARLVRALQRNGIAISETRRRGKWIAILAQKIKKRRLPSRRFTINGGLETAAP